ncbi:hypothetical protein Asal01_00472 [Fodinibius salicampi]
MIGSTMDDRFPQYIVFSVKIAGTNISSKFDFIIKRYFFGTLPRKLC